MVIVLMGAAGSGKTTIGRALAAELGWRFVEGDDYHPAANVKKMHAGVPLTDADRAPWLANLSTVVGRALDRREPIVLACSALKERYRVALRGDHRGVRFAYLKGDEPLLDGRLRKRSGHFFDPQLLRSQLAALEEPHDPTTVVIDASLQPERILSTIREEFGV